MQRVLVTGASGFIGRHLCAYLKASNMDVTALMRHEVMGPWDQLVRADLSQERLSADVLRGIDTIFHLAGKAHALSDVHQDETDYFDANQLGTRLLLEAAQQAGVRRIVFFSSVKAMGEGGDQCLDEAAVCEPETPYGKSKLEAERLVLSGGYLPEPVVLRLAMVYGPTAKGNLPRMMQAISQNRFPPLPEVNNRRSMVHVDDVVALAMVAATRAAAVGQVYIVTDGQPYTTREMYEEICAVLRKPLPKWTLPMPLMRLLAKLGDGIGQLRGRRFVFDSDVMDKLIGSAWYSSEKARHELGFSTQYRLPDALPDMMVRLGIEPRNNG